MQTTNTIETARRAIEICNACRYCDGYCAVFDAMALRRHFTAADLTYLANLCHNCRNCYYACQYAPPHEFAVNLPKYLSEVRAYSYQQYAWPRPFASFFHRHRVIGLTVAAMAIIAILAVNVQMTSSVVSAAAEFEQAGFSPMPAWRTMAYVAAAALGLSLVSLSVSTYRFWRDINGGSISKINPSRALLRVTGDVLTLRNLKGGGHGCNDRDESFSHIRRYCHHAVFYGFWLCFAATMTAGIYEHILHAHAPYALSSAPVIFGVAGGVGIFLGCIGLALIKMTADPAPVSRKLLGSEYMALGLLAAVAGSGLAVLMFRETGWMSFVLALHLGLVLSFFLLLPYSKFVHGAYRAAALLRAAMEREAFK